MANDPEPSTDPVQRADGARAAPLSDADADLHDWAGFARLTLRERKRLRTMRRIQSVALDLFEEHGFDEVTIERIAERSEVSPSSIYRYFGTKEKLVIWDEYDPMGLQAIMEELHDHPPLEAVRRVVTELMMEAFEGDEERIHRRMRLAFTYPSIEAASTLQTYEMAQLIAGILGQQLDRDPDELDVQVFSHAFVGGVLGGLRHWYASGFTTSLDVVIDRVLAAMEGRLELA